MSQSPSRTDNKSPLASSPPPQPEADGPPNAFSLHNLPPTATWRGVKDVINDIFPCWCMVRIVVPGIANVELKTSQVAAELTTKLQDLDMEGFILNVQPSLSPQQAILLQHQVMLHHQMQMGIPPMGMAYNQYGGYPQSPQHYPGGPPQYMPYMPQYMPFYPGSPPISEAYIASSTTADATSHTASPSANSVTSSGASSLTSSPMPYYVPPVGPEWAQAPPMFNMAMAPGFVPYNHSPRMRRFGGAYGAYGGGYGASYGGGYKPRMMNWSDTPLDKQRLFVGNIPFATTWYELKGYLRECGPVSHVEIQTNDMGDSLGFAIVTFDDEETARRAIDMFDGKIFVGRALKVHYDRVPPKKHYSPHHNNGTSHNGAPTSNSLGASATPAGSASPTSGVNGYNRYKGFKPFVPGETGNNA